MAVLGGTGFVGSRLWPRLLAGGAEVTLGSRRAVPTPKGVTHARCDLESGEGLEAALDGIDVAYFLVHGMAGGADFADRERVAAERFIAAAASRGVGKVVYLGGLYPPGELSDHLQSRRQVGRLLIEGVGALAVRAGVIVGAGSTSFDILYGLCQRLPLMLAPRWLASRCQPIGISDTIESLAGAATLPAAREVDLVGPDVLSYREMLEITGSELNGRRPVMFPVPLLSPELSAHWLRFVTRVNMNVARSLVTSLRHDLVADRPLLTAELGINPAGFRETVRTALASMA
ncbi:MAG: hypothetical protein NVS9B1_19860 [Candidatus Dormibacteraceae bacterium]